MIRARTWGIVCAALVSAGNALATPTAQQKCDEARVTARKVYETCVDAVVAKDAKGVSVDEYKAFWKCRHAYFKKWTSFQSKVSLAGSTCVGARHADNGSTITDNLTGLEWEKKTDDGSIHDKDNIYSWSTGTPYKGDGAAFATFLTGAGTGLNVVGFAGANDWRLPTLAELQTILMDFPCTGTGGGSGCICPGACIAPSFASFDPNTQIDFYWTSTGSLPSPNLGWYVYFYFGFVTNNPKTSSYFVRAVRGGL